VIEFILNNTQIRTEEKSGMSLLHFIREVQGLKGTKSGCKEGDCGACTVLVGSLEENNAITYKSITSCLAPLANVHGKHVVSVEGVNLKDELNVAQQAIANNFATQCGFCTPGFVNSLTGLALQHKVVEKVDGINALSGNICRCTGYKSLKKASDEVTRRLQKINTSDQIAWLVENNFIPNYFKKIPQKLKEINISKMESEGVLVSGGTDLYVSHADELLETNIQIAKNFVPNDISFTGRTCTIGANATVSDLVENKKLNTYFPNLQQYLKLVSSEQIRNMGSIGGNFVNASPIGDMSIFFLALNSKLHIQNSIAERRTIPFSTFFIDYKKYDLKDNEYIQSISFDIPNKNTYFNFEKVSKRTHLDIASVNAAARIEVVDNVITNAYVAVGGVAAIPKNLQNTASFLQGRSLNKSTVLKAQEFLQDEISPISDVRGTAEYKRLLARQLFYAHFIKLFPELFELKDLVA